MDPELRKLLEKDVELNEENNAMLKRLLGALRLAQIWAVIKWVVIIGSAVGAYYWLQPLLESTLRGYESLLGNDTAQTSDAPEATSTILSRILDSI